MPAVLPKNKKTEDITKNKYQLTDLQKEFLQLLLPRSMTIRTTDLTDQKRNRTPKKTEEIYDVQFFNQAGHRHVGPGSSSNPKNEKKISTKEKEKISENSREKVNQNIVQKSPIQIKRRDEAKKRKDSHYSPNQKQTSEKDFRYGPRVVAKKNKKTVPQNPVKIDEEVLKKSLENIQSIKQGTEKLEGQKNFVREISVKQERIEIKRNNKKKQSSKNSGSQLNEQAESHSFAPVQSQKEENSISFEGQKNSSPKIKGNTKLNINEQNSRRQIIFTGNVIQNIVDNSQEMANSDRQLSPSSKTFCLKFLNKLKQYKASWPFRLPVDPVAQGVPNYLEVIHIPMDMKTIQKKLASNKYEHAAEFHGDINKIFLNSYKFNPRETNYYKLTAQLQAYYYELLQEVEVNPSFLYVDQMARVKTNKVELDFTEETPMKKKKSIVCGKKVFRGKNLEDKDKDSSEGNKESAIQEYSRSKRVESCPMITETPLETVNQEKINGLKQIEVVREHQNLQEQHLNTPKKTHKAQKNSQRMSQKKKSQKQLKQTIEMDNKNTVPDLLQDHKYFSIQEKRHLSERIKKLPREYLQNVLIIIYGEDYINNSNPHSDFDIEIDGLPEETLKQLDIFIKEREMAPVVQPNYMQKYFINDQRLYLFDSYLGTF